MIVWLAPYIVSTIWRLPCAAPYDPPPPDALTTNLRRLYTSETVHVGLAVHTDGSGGALTLQVTR